MSETQVTTTTNGPTPSGTAAIEAAAAALVGGDTPNPQGDPADGDKPLGEGGEKALKAEREARARAERERNEFKARLDAIETAGMSEVDRAKKAAEDAQAELAKMPQMVADQLRGYLAGIHEIPQDQVDLYLTSNDPAVLLRQAAGIAERTRTTPKPDPSQGASHTAALNGDGLTDALARAVGARQ